MVNNKKIKKYITKNAKGTIKLGIWLGKKLKGNEIICLEGDLGTGKTTFVKGIAVSLGIIDDITSPTYILVNEYKGDMDLYHFDTYRIFETNEVIEAGFNDYLEKKGIKIIEWANLIAEIIPQNVIWVHITRDLENENIRIFKIDMNKTKREY